MGAHQDAKADEHFVAHLKIEKVVKRTPTLPNGDPRTVSEVTSILLKADELDRLITKLGAHIELIEEN